MSHRPTRGARAALPDWLLRLHRHTRSSLLVLGGSEPDRLAVARAFHGAGPVRCGRMLAVHCGRDARPLERALTLWIALDPGASGPNPLAGCECGTLFLDEVRLLGAPAQRLLLALARRLQDAEPGAPPAPCPNRLVAGDTEDLLVAVREARFSGALFDGLDKIRVEVGRMAGRGAA